MPDIFGLDLAGLIGSIMSEYVFDQTLIKVSSVRDPTNPTKKLQVEESHPCKGFVDNFEAENAKGGSVRITDLKIVIFGDSLPVGVVPEPGDKITAENGTFVIVDEGVARDPAGATYECRSK
jgi:hypothetical protein